MGSLKHGTTTQSAQGERPTRNAAAKNAHFIRTVRAAGLHPPESLTLMVTKGCNLHCRHCWLECRPLGQTPPVPLSILKRVINDFAAMGGSTIHLTGGEILGHPDWLNLLHYCCQHTGIKAVCLQTNATLITLAHIEAWLALPLNRLSIQVSLDGARAETHDLVRGPGSFAAAMRGLHLLAEGGLGQRTQIAFTEMRHNFSDLPLLLKLVDLLGIDRLVAGTLVKGGRAARAAKIELPLPSQYRELIELYRQDARFRELYDRKATISAIEWFKGLWDTPGEACGCIQNLFLTADMQLYPCVMLQNDTFVRHDSRRRSLAETVRQALPVWRKLPVISRQRSDSLSECKACPGRIHCAGGCMGRAYAVHGDLMQPEDRCALRKSVYFCHNHRKMEKRGLSCIQHTP